MSPSISREQFHRLPSAARVALRWWAPRFLAPPPIRGRLLRSLGGQSRSDVRAKIERFPDLALVMADETVPDGWPSEILQIERSEDRITWHVLTGGGRWIPFYSYSHEYYVQHSKLVPGYLYCRNSRIMALRRLAVTPVASTLFNASGHCRPFHIDYHALMNSIRFNAQAYGWQNAV